MPTPGRFLAIALMALLLGPWARAQDLDAAKRADIDRLLTLTRATDMARASMDQVGSQLIRQIQQRRADVTAEHAAAMLEAQRSVVDENIGVLNELFVQLYHRHFSADDIRSILAFYETPAGQRLLQAMPALSQESIDAGMQFGRLLGPKIEQRTRERLKAKGLTI